MGKKTRKITISAVLAALAVIVLFLASVFPTGQLGIIAVASLFVVAAVIETGLVAAVFVFVVSSILGLIILPDKSAVLLYILFFGWYPIIKSLAERIENKKLGFIVKLAAFNVSNTIIWFMLRNTLFPSIVGKYDTVLVTVLVYIAANIVFVIYDFGLSRLIGLYIARISRLIKK